MGANRTDAAGKAGDRGVTAKDNRLFVEAVLWIARVGARGAICPKRLARGTACTSASRWSNADVWHRVFAELGKDAHFEEVFVDSTLVRAHQHAAGAAKNGDSAIGRCRGG